MIDEQTAQTLSTLSRRDLMSIALAAGGISVATPALAGVSLGKALGAVEGVAKSESITDADVKAYSAQMAVEMDKQNPVAGPKTPYGKRIAALSSNLKAYNGLNLNIKAYLVKDINAFAMADGTIRVFAGLMDKFTDDEIRYVIAHEIGHVQAGHTRKRMQAALRTAALKDAAGSAGGGVGRMASGQLGDLFGKVIVSQHSQANEKEADDLAMVLMKAKGYPGMACVTALEKLAAMETPGSANWLSTHPSPAARAKRMKAALAA
jgi:putative metalloprotease